MSKLRLFQIDFSVFQWFVRQPVFWILLSLTALGMVMVVSTSLHAAQAKLHQPFYFVWHQGLFFIVGWFFLCCMLLVPTQYWYKYSGYLWLLGIVALALLFVPGMGKHINGAVRWLNVPGVSIQVSEFVKFIWVLYLSRFLVKHQDELHRLRSFVMVMGLFLVMAFFLIKEPDYGTTMLLMGLTFMLCWVTRVNRLWLVLFICLGVFGAVVLVQMAPYRMQRIIGFLHPWAHASGSGYQLTQSLMAIGHGGFWGVGIGNSLQKWFYLPEAHTDFVFAILTEEFGLMGALGTLFAYIFLWMQCAQSDRHHTIYHQLITLGIGFMIVLQALCHMAVTCGWMPTKGLTLPLVSYGGSSCLSILIAMGIVIRARWESF